MRDLNSVVDDILKPIDQAKGMACEFYLDANYVDNERDLVLAKGWAALELKSELPEKGWVKPIEFLKLPLLITHASDGKVRVFHNVCRHRGMILVDEESAIEGVISCPYHSWTYTLEGELKGTPNFAGIGEHESSRIDKSIFGLKEVASAEFMNVLFINLDGKAQSFDEHIKPLKERWQAFLGERGFEQMSMAQADNKAEFEVDCNWKLAVENFAEAYHLPTLHPDLNTTSPLGVHYNIMVNENFSGQGTLNYKDETESANLPVFSHWPTDKYHQAEYMCIYPNLLTGIQHNHAYVIVLFPLNATQTLEKLEIFYIGDGADSEQYESARATALNFWMNVFSEDVFAVEGLQKGRSSPYYDGGIYAVPLEEPTHHFHQWVASRLKSSL